MSDAKREQLMKAGKLAKDGTRIPSCPLCGQPLPEGVDLAGAAAAVVETVEASATTETEAK